MLWPNCAGRLKKLETRLARRREAAAPLWSSPSSGSIRRSRSGTGSRSRSAGRAAGTCSVARASRQSATSWQAIREVDPEMLILMPCGFHLSETVAEWGRTPKPPFWRRLEAVSRGQVFAVNGSAYFSRPGPRVIDGIALLAEIFDPEGFVETSPLGSWTPLL